MPLSLEKYAELLDKRGEPHPLGPDPVPFERVKPMLRPLPGIRCVVYSGYGAAMLISGGELSFLNPDPVMRKIAFDKTVHEFKMWASMTRKPGEPSEYMASIFGQIFDNLMMHGAQQKDFAPRIEKVWEGIVNRLIQKDYVVESGTYGDGEEFARKVSYFYVRASQGVSLLPNAGKVFANLHDRDIIQGLHADWQCTEPVRFWRLLFDASRQSSLATWFDPAVCSFSGNTGIKKTTDRGFVPIIQGLQSLGIGVESVLYVGADVENDIAPAKRRGFRTALLLADQASARVTPEHLQDPRTRPDRLLTSLEQVVEIVR